MIFFSPNCAQMNIFRRAICDQERPKLRGVGGGGGIYANYSKRKKGSNNSLKTVARGIKLNIIEIWIKKNCE